ncbi:MAG: phosphoribosylaminoimidazolesuccinocarboxamide synthase, partial [Bacteroidales bacterium]
PRMDDDIVQQISNRYIELFEKITGEAFLKTANMDVLQRIENNCRLFLENQNPGRL